MKDLAELSNRVKINIKNLPINKLKINLLMKCLKELNYRINIHIKKKRIVKKNNIK
jgi:hypothetical protein